VLKLAALPDQASIDIGSAQGTASEFLEHGTICTHKSWKCSLA
jgi:hypothetical protein